MPAAGRTQLFIPCGNKSTVVWTIITVGLFDLRTNSIQCSFRCNAVSTPLISANIAIRPVFDALLISVVSWRRSGFVINRKYF